MQTWLAAAPEQTNYANLTRAHLNGADLGFGGGSRADLSGAHLEDANLRGYPE